MVNFIDFILYLLNNLIYELNFNLCIEVRAFLLFKFLKKVFFKRFILFWIIIVIFLGLFRVNKIFLLFLFDVFLIFCGR